MANNKLFEDPLLQKWMNPVYLNEDMLKEFHDFYGKNKKELQYMQWTEFLKPEKATSIAEQLKKGHYVPVSIPDMHNFNQAKPYAAVDPMIKFLTSEALKAYIRAVFEKDYRQQQVEIRSFVHGNYTLLHDAIQTFEGFVLIYDPMGTWQQDYGGYEVVTRQNKDPLVIPPSPNTLTIINSTKETRWFTKYVNSLAGDKKRYSIWITCK